MGKIPVQELARMMGITNQDLVFKLRSIGVRVEGDNAHIDTDMISAILQGKKLPHPREVILRDEAAAATAPPPQRRAPLGRRMPPNPLRPSRPRTLIQKVEPRIQTIPVTERPAPPAAVAEAQPKVAATPEAPAAEAPRAAKPAEAARPAAATEVRAEHRPEEREARPGREEKKPKRAKKTPSREELDEDLKAYRGSVKEIEAAEEEAEAVAVAGPASTRRRRRAERKKEEGTGVGKVLAFKEAPPHGPVMISEGMTVRDFAEKLGVKAKDLIKTLFKQGIMANINHILEPEMAQKVAAEMGIETLVVSFEEEVQLKQEMSAGGDSEPRIGRAPVVTIMGHVDHGKTSLLDAIRESKIAEGEAGGITQHIGAYRVEVGGRPIVFLDTPGHEAFTLMRARGARATDIVVLMVAADDGVMPQTVEAIDHARAAKVPMVVAINKIDKANANADKVKKQLADHDVLVEEWGGEVVAVPISATKRQGIEDLLEMILLTAEIKDLKAAPTIPGQGTVLEARKDVGRGIVATVLVQDGSVGVGDVFVSGATWGRVRAMMDDDGQRIATAGPSTPVEITGFGELPEAGDLFQIVEDEVKARSIADFRRQEQRKREMQPSAGKLSLEQLFDRIEVGEVKELGVVLKADVQGSVEVLRDTLEKLSTDKVKVRVLLAGAGAISTNDVLLASASNAVVIGFNVRPERTAAELAEKEGVDIRLHTVIYELTDELRKAMAGMLEPEYQEVTKGRAEVRQIFRVPKVGTVAGCHVIEGVIPRNASVRLLRDNVVVYEGKMASLRRFKEDASEVRTGFDCGIALERFQDLKPEDVIEAYVREEVAPVL
jgi:translation initiation factor IF-2